jgi:hypothetical protein
MPGMMANEEPLSLFIPYSHSDDLLRAKLGKHLEALRRTCNVQPWHDRRIIPGHGPAPFPWTVFCLRCWVIFAFICLLLGSYNAGRSGVAGVRSAGFFLGDLACP